MSLLVPTGKPYQTIFPCQKQQNDKGSSHDYVTLIRIGTRVKSTMINWILIKFNQLIEMWLKYLKAEMYAGSSFTNWKIVSNCLMINKIDSNLSKVKHRTISSELQPQNVNSIDKGPKLWNSYDLNLM